MKFIYAFTLTSLIACIHFFAYGTIRVKTKKFKEKNLVYINDDSLFYYIDSVGLDTSNFDNNYDEPRHAVLFINNNPLTSHQLYIHKGNFEIEIDIENNTVKINGSSLNDEYKELTRIKDSLYSKYDLNRAILYPYIGMNPDSALDIKRKYLRYADSLSNIHMDNFYKNNNSSFLTLEYIYNILSYIYDTPKYDTTLFNFSDVTKMFDNLDTSLYKYQYYAICKNLLKNKPNTDIQYVKSVMSNFDSIRISRETSRKRCRRK